MPILVTQNLKRECMFNMMEFTIDEIDEHGTSFKVNNVWFGTMISDKVLSLHFAVLCINTKVPISKKTIISSM